jgi:hypothetical protein
LCIYRVNDVGFGGMVQWSLGDAHAMVDSRRALALYVSVETLIAGTANIF